MKQVSVIDQLQSHTELKHRGGGTAAENMSILLFRKGALLEDWKQINAGYRPRQPNPVNCTQRDEQNNKNHLWAFIDGQHFSEHALLPDERKSEKAQKKGLIDRSGTYSMHFAKALWLQKWL